jgi:hypothetical protein
MKFTRLLALLFSNIFRNLAYMHRADYSPPAPLRVAAAWARAAKLAAGTPPSLRLAVAPWIRDASFVVIGVAGARVGKLDFFDMIFTSQIILKCRDRQREA